MEREFGNVAPPRRRRLQSSKQTRGIDTIAPHHQILTKRFTDPSWTLLGESIVAYRDEFTWTVTGGPSFQFPPRPAQNAFFVSGPYCWSVVKTTTILFGDDPSGESSCLKLGYLKASI